MIKTDEELNDLVNRAQEVDAIAIDTEFVWEKTFYPQLGLIQVALTPGKSELIDPIKIKDLSPLGKVLENPNIVKILHDAQQDLSILYQVTGSLPQNVFDTRCASGFASLPSTISLQNMLKTLLDIELPKTESRTNWLQRPLSANQLEYAADDVKFLHEVRDVILKRVEEKGTTEWLKEELATYDSPELYKGKDPYLQYKRVKAYGRLNSRGLAILREVAVWREGAARKSDRPRKHILSDENLIDISQEIPETLEELKATKIVYGKKLASYGKDIVECVLKGCAIPLSECPEPPVPPNNRKVLKQQMQTAKQFITSNAERHGVDPALLGTRAELEAVAEGKVPLTAENHRIMRGWRKEFMGDEQINKLAGIPVK